MEPHAGIDQKQAINRFVSSLTAAYRTFHLYRNNNKALDEMLDTLLVRSKDAITESLKLGLTNRSVVHEGDVVGDPKLSQYLAYQLRVMGIKEMIFRPPLQGRHFFQLLHVLASHDSLEVKIEKLAPLIGDEAEKPICLVPMTSHSILLRLTDDLLALKLDPLGKPANQGGLGLWEELEQHPPQSLGDLYTQIAVRAEGFEKSIRVFVRNLLDATREGYFPVDRFLTVFPLPPPLKNAFQEKIRLWHQTVERKATPLGLACLPKPGFKRKGRTDWKTFLTGFTKDEIKLRHDLSLFGAQSQGQAELELATAMIKDEGPNFHLGLKILIRVLNQKNSTAVQEKALKIGLATWLQKNKPSDDMILLSQLSSLRQALALPHNLTMALFPLRSLSAESELFGKFSTYLLSLGEIILPSLIQALETEEDRGMRKKLCLILTSAAREQGTGQILAALEAATPFLLRNLIMVLGDVRSNEALQNLSDLASHSQKIVRVEALRSLGKIGTDSAAKTLLRTVERSSFQDERKIALDQLTARGDRSVLDTLVRLARHEQHPSDWKNELIKSIGTLGGAAAKTFLESLLKSGGLLSGFNAHAKEEQALVQALIKRIGA